MIYKLRWTFPSAGGTPPPLSAAAVVQVAQEKLLEAAATAATETPLPLFAQVRSNLVDLARDINSTVSGSDESFDVSLMVFDERSNRLRFVGTNSDKLPEGDFYSGEGCAGFAFEKASSILYHPARDKIGYFIQRKERPNEEGSQNP